MPIVDGTAVDAANTNAQKLDKVSDDTAVGKITLSNVDAVSGSSVTNLQREHNSAASFMGKALNSAKDDLPAWTANNGLTSTDDLFERTDALSAKFHQSSGHAHTGAAGDAPPVDFSDLAGTQLIGYAVQGTNITGASGTSDDVSSLLTGETPSTAQNVEGIVVNAPHNYIHIFDTSHDAIFDGSGNKVYGRLTESSGVWTLSYYSNVAGTETAYSFAAPTDLVWYYQQLFTESDRPVYSDIFEVRSDEVAPIAPTPGLDEVLAVDNSTGGTDIDMDGGSLLDAEFVEVQEIATPAAPGANKVRVYAKSDGKLYKMADDSIEEQVGSPQSLADTLLEGNSAGASDIDLNDNALLKVEFMDGKHITTPANPAAGYVRLYFKSDDKLYKITSAGVESEVGASASPSLYGSRGTPRDVVAGTGITSGASHMSTTAVSQVVFIQGSGGAVNISANPQIEAHTVVGSRMVLNGRSDTNTVTLETGDGLDLNGDAIMGASHVLELVWDGTNWLEMNRNF
jgi:hypothetical protein